MDEGDIDTYLLYALLIFLTGMNGIVIRRQNIIIILMCVELMLLAININFGVFSVFLDDIIGQLYALIVLTVAAGESAIGLAILVVYYRVHGTILTPNINSLKG